MKRLLPFLLAVSFTACHDSHKRNDDAQKEFDNKKNTGVHEARLFKGALTGGMKGDSIFFRLSEDRKTLSDLTFKGYWRCNGKLEMLAGAGPDGNFEVLNGKVKGHISEPPNGGSTAWRFDLDADIQDHTATGTFRMNINNLGCDTYLLNFTASAD